MSAHLPVLPIALTMLFGALQLLLERRGIVVQRVVSWLSIFGLLLISIGLIQLANTDVITAYLVGDWPARLGIALVVDRLSAWMVLLTTLLSAACLLHASSSWDRRAPHFHALFQFQLMGLIGAFLTGDLFNLFVFFEILLASSYGLLLSGGRGGRMRVGFHYVTFNIAASTLFLIALGLIYGLLGTLNMAEMAVRVSQLAAEDQAIVKAVAGLLMVVFCAKGAIFPLYLWLPGTYGRAQPAVAALFVIMTKVGIYSVLRVFTLIFGNEAGALSGFAWEWLFPAGVLTVMMAALGVLAAVRMRIKAGYLVLVSAGTLFIAFSLNTPHSVAAGLYYLAHSTFTGAAMFLIVEMIRQHRTTDRLTVILPMIHRALPGTLFMIVAIAAIGLPPLSGFIGKFSLLASTSDEQLGWVWGTILLSGFFVLVALTRAGAKLFWIVPPEGTQYELNKPSPYKGRRSEVAAIVLLLVYILAMTIAAGPATRYTQAAGVQLLNPSLYIQAVREKPPLLREP